MEKVFEVTRESVSITYRGERFYTKPWGLFGGHPGASGRAFVLRKTGEREEIPSKSDKVLNEGDQLYFFTPGGGGYGDPLKRQPELVLRDVLDRKVSLEAALEDYGVVIDEEAMALDLERTEGVRREREGVRGPITWTYDRGPGLGRE